MPSGDPPRTATSTGPSPQLPVDAREAQEALGRILTSTPFRTSPRASAFLRHVVEETLAGRADGIRERSIAAAALGRGPDFDPRIDPAVRVQAGRVRRALDRYYGDEGAEDPVHIALPVGAYVPEFLRADGRPRGGTTDGPRLVVLSFADLTPGGGPAHLAAGLSEILVTVLSGYPGLQVIDPVTLAGGTTADPRALGEAHDADYLLLGSTGVRGTAMRVSARLVETGGGATVWSHIFDASGDGDGALEVEDRIAAGIAAAVADYRGVVHLRAVPRPGARRDPVVHRAMLGYYGWLATTDPEGYLPTVRSLEAAVEREPDNALLLGMLAGMTLVGAIDGVGDLEDPLGRARELVARAVAADPGNPHAIAAEAWLALVEKRIPDCHERMDEVLRRCPHHPTFLYRAGFVFAVTGRWDRGVALIEESLRLNPSGPGYLNFFPAMDLCLRGEDAAALQRASLVHTPGGHLGPVSRAVPLARLGRTEEALRELDALRAAVPGFDDDRPAALRRMLMPPPVAAVILEALDRVGPAAPR